MEQYLSMFKWNSSMLKVEQISSANFKPFNSTSLLVTLLAFLRSVICNSEWICLSVHADGNWKDNSSYFHPCCHFPVFLFSKDDWLSSKLKSITADIQNLPRSGFFCDVPHRGKTKKCKKKSRHRSKRCYWLKRHT